VHMSLPSSLVPDDLTQERRSRADHMLGRLYEAVDRLKDRTVLVRSTQHHDIQSMLAFRGVTVTNRELAQIDLPNVKMRRLPYNVARYVQVMGDATRDIRTSSVGEVLKRVARDLAELWEGAESNELPWRTTPRWFGESPRDSSLLAPPPGDGLRVATEQLFEWIDSTTRMTLVDKVALGAHQLFSLDPFTNTADLLHVLATLLLVKGDVLQDQIVPIAVHLDRNRDQFRQLHEHVMRTRDYNGVVRFIADGLFEQCENQLRVVHALSRLPQRYIDIYIEKTQPERRRDGFARVVAILPSFQIVTSQLISDRCLLSPKRARELLLKAEEYEFVELVETRGRAKIYEVKDVRRAIDLYAGMVPEKDCQVTRKYDAE
jgi:hypothetical protein